MDKLLLDPYGLRALKGESSKSNEEEMPAKVKQVFGTLDEGKKLPKSIQKAGLKIVPFETSKHKIKQRPNMEKNIIPKHPSSVIFNGRSGSGKSNLMVNLLTRPEFYGGKNHYFDKVHLFSPTAGAMDDLCKHLIDYTPLERKDIHNEFDNDMLQDILDKQALEIDEKGIDKADKALIILDDIQADQKFLRGKSIKKVFLMNRHHGVSTWLCGQSFNLTPRACRLQANNLFIFPCSKSEHKVLIDEFTPPNKTKKDMSDMLDYATRERYNFLHINMKEQPETRYRHNLDVILKLKE